MPCRLDLQVADLLDKRIHFSSIRLPPMIVYLANKTQFRADILSNRIEKIVRISDDCTRRHLSIF